MKLTTSTIYIRDDKSTSYIYVYGQEETISLSTLENVFVFTKEELTNLLGQTFDAGYVFYQNTPFYIAGNQERDVDARISKEQFINNLIH